MHVFLFPAKQQSSKNSSETKNTQIYTNTKFGNDLSQLLTPNIANAEGATGQRKFPGRSHRTRATPAVRHLPLPCSFPHPLKYPARLCGVLGALPAPLHCREGVTGWAFSTRSSPNGRCCHKGPLLPAVSSWMVAAARPLSSTRAPAPRSCPQALLSPCHPQSGSPDRLTYLTTPIPYGHRWKQVKPL